MTNNISEKDKKDWENFLSKNEKLPNKDIKLDKKIPLKIRSIDLHGYTLEEANKSIQDFINKSYEDKINKLIVVGIPPIMYSSRHLIPFDLASSLETPQTINFEIRLS